jgi:hypothetical protein
VSDREKESNKKEEDEEIMKQDNTHKNESQPLSQTN